MSLNIFLINFNFTLILLYIHRIYILDCIKHWKALKQWKDLKYLINMAGNRLVPIEIGSRYTDENWSQQLLNFSEFLQKYILTKNDQVGYLAQHQLFEQVLFYIF